ncbi:DUF3566 domain-containing protein [Nocardioides anomalus]|nr:DUF3566 domain-containing protein [Nocardioides anomalus]
MADRPSNTGREDTVALPRTPQQRPPQNGSGNGRVLPPMPAGEDAAGESAPSAAPPAAPATPANGTRNGSAAPAPAKKAAPARTPRPVTKKTARPAAKKAAPRPTAPAAAPAAAAQSVAQPSPATQATPAVRTAEPVRPAAAPPPVVAAPAPAVPQEKAKPARTAKPAKPTREQKRAAAAAAAPQAGRRARLRVTRVDPWSVMKTSFLLSIALGIVIVVSVLMVWTVLGAADVWNSINQTVQDVVGGQDASTFDIEDYLGTRRVVGFTMIVAAVDVVLVTAICTLGAFLYNMSASLLGGVEVTLAEDN